MMTHLRSKVLLAGLLSVASTAMASDPLTLSLSTPTNIPPGQNFTVFLKGCPGDTPIYLGSPTLGPTVFPKVGLLDIGAPIFIAVLPTIPASGQVNLPCDVPCLTLTAPFSMHFQAFTVLPTTNGFKVTDLSNALTITMDPSLTADCNQNNIPDSCEIEDGAPDCNGNGVPDSCDIKGGAELDENGNGIPDSCEEILCVENGTFDGLSPKFGTPIGGLYLNTKSIGKNWFLEPGARVIEANDGTARLLGTVRSETDSACRLDVDVELSHLVEPGDANYPPSNSPKLELSWSAYVTNGGSIDPSTWRYYTTLDGTLTGLGKLDGALLELAVNTSPPQFGQGASGMNDDYGSSAWIKYSTKSQPHDSKYKFYSSGSGDFHVDLRDCEEICPSTYKPDSFGTDSSSVHSLNLPDVVSSLGVSRDFHFTDGARLTELADGTALLEGRVVNQDDADICFDVRVDFTGRVVFGDASFPPAGSPKKELKSGAYLENGGPVEVDTWRYYTNFTGTLTGSKKLDGAVVSLVKKGPAFQIGNGANGKNVAFGASAWISYSVDTQPTNSAMVLGGDAGGPNDINIDLEACPKN